MMKRFLLTILYIPLLLFVVLPWTNAANRYSRASGNWNSNTIWSATAAGATGASYPVAGDVVYIQAGHAITVTGENAACTSITITDSGSSLTVNSPFSLTVSGDISLNNLATGSTSFSLTGGGSASCNNLRTGTTSLNPTGIYIHTFLSSISSFTILGNANINSYCQNKNRVSNGALAISGGTLTVNGTVITTNEDVLQNNSYLALGAANLVLNGLVPFNFTLTGTNTIILNGASDSHVIYNASGAQNVYTTTYSNLTLSGSGIKTLSSPAVSGILSMEGTATTAGTAPVYGAAATLQYRGTAGQITGIEFPAAFSGTGGVIINNLSGVSLDAGRVISCTLNLTAGEFSIGSNTLTLQTSSLPISRTAGTITTTSSSNLSFGSAGNTGGNAFSIPSGTFTFNPAPLNNLSVYRANELILGDQVISVGGIVLCNGPLVTNGNLTLSSTPARTGLIDGSGTGSVTGNVTMQRYLATGGYKYFSSPFSDATVSQFSEEVDLAASFPRFYGYNETDTASGWFTHTSGTLNNLEGYAVNFGDLGTITTVNVTGTVNNGNISRTLTNTNYTYTQGFNLIGNPYPSPVDWNAPAGWTRTNIDAALYFFRAEGADIYSGTYYYYVAPGVFTGDASSIIPSMQGFFVHVTDGAFPVSGSVACNNSVRVNDLTHTFIKSEREPDFPFLKLSASFKDKGSPDPLLIYFHEKGTTEFDSRLDAYKLINTDVLTPSLYSITGGGSRLAINALPDDGDSLLVIPLGIKIQRDGNISFNLAECGNLPSGTAIYLHDNETGTDIILDEKREYTINLPAGEYDERFSLRLINKVRNVPENWPGQNLLNAYVYKGKLIADIGMIIQNRGAVIICNVTGQVVSRKDISSLGYHEFDLSLKPGIYIITYRTGKFIVSKKVFIP